MLLKKIKYSHFLYAKTHIMNRKVNGFSILRLTKIKLQHHENYIF